MAGSGRLAGKELGAFMTRACSSVCLPVQDAVRVAPSPWPTHIGSETASHKECARVSSGRTCNGASNTWAQIAHLCSLRGLTRPTGRQIRVGPAANTNNRTGPTPPLARFIYYFSFPPAVSRFTIIFPFLVSSGSRSVQLRRRLVGHLTITENGERVVGPAHGDDVTLSSP